MWVVFGWCARWDERPKREQNQIALAMRELLEHIIQNVIVKIYHVLWVIGLWYFNVVIVYRNHTNPCCETYEKYIQVQKATSNILIKINICQGKYKCNYLLLDP